MPHKPAAKARARFTVRDLCRVRSGPTAVRQLADWGANVIKIELPEALDAKEAMGGKRHGRETGVFKQDRTGTGTYNEYGYQRSEEHTSELQSLMRISHADFC